MIISTTSMKKLANKTISIHQAEDHGEPYVHSNSLGHDMEIPFTLARAFLVALAIHTPSVTVAETSWNKAIEAVEAQSSEYFDYAMSLGSGYPGTALNGIGHDRHICAITGRMLGFREEIAEAETFESPPMTPDADPYQLIEHALFLDSWAATARGALKMTEDQKKSLWNLECLG